MKNQIVKKNKSEALISIVAPGTEMDAAARINHFHRISMQAGEVAIKAALEVGMQLFQEKVRRGGTFQAWVEQNCDFSVRTSYNYLNLLQKSIGAKNDLAELSDTSEKKREEVINEFSKKVESKTLSELMCDYGIITRSKSNMGGKREGAGRKRKADLATAAGAAEAADNAGFAAQNTIELVGKVYEEGVIHQGFDAMDKSDLVEMVKLMKMTLAEAENVLKVKVRT